MKKKQKKTLKENKVGEVIEEAVLETDKLINLIYGLND